MALALDMGSAITATITSFIRYLSIESYTFQGFRFHTSMVFNLELLGVAV